MAEEKKIEAEVPSIFDEIDSVLKTVDIKNISSESAGNSELKPGYYLLEVEKNEIKYSKSSGNPMVAFQLKVIEDGWATQEQGDEVSLIPVKGTKNRKVFKYYPLTKEKINFFISDMLKFEGEKPGEPLLEKEAFTNSAFLGEALECLVGKSIYCNVSAKENEDGTMSIFYNFLTWKRAKALGLPIIE